LDFEVWILDLNFQFGFPFCKSNQSTRRLCAPTPAKTPPDRVWSAANAINLKIVCSDTGKNAAGSCVVCNECYQSEDYVQRDWQNASGSSVVCMAVDPILWTKKELVV
jgi:hypothetical protein